MAAGPDGALYVATPAFGADTSIGGIIRVDLSRPQPMTVSPNIVEMSTCDVPTPEPRPSTLGGAGAVASTGMIPTPAQSAAGNSDAGSGAEASNQGGKSATGAFAIEIKNFSFNPKELTVPVGTTVTWTNLDSVAHTATADAGAFNSGNLNPGQSFSFQFDKPGTYVYNCSYHPSMQGTIIVK
jgi:plastocyanin